ncbi:MAG: hypothetical protein MUC97_15635 [Bernardetiaceae bacterium]|jgi:hypothetical protein|nr:hypothetical protein [Bernardetiaceae bacterium]
MTCQSSSVATACCPACAQRHAACNIADGFLYGRYLLRQPQRQKLVEIARRLLASPRAALRTPVRLVAHLDAQEFRQGRFHLAQRRATEAARALRQLLERLKPNSSARFRLVVVVARRFQPAGRLPAQNRRVEVCLPHHPAHLGAGPVALVRFGLVIRPLPGTIRGELESDVARRRAAYTQLVKDCLNKVGQGLVKGSRASEIGTFAWQVELEVPAQEAENHNLYAGNLYRDKVGDALRQCLGQNWIVEIEGSGGPASVAGLPGKTRKPDIVITQRKTSKGGKMAQFYVESKLGRSPVTHYQKQTDAHNQKYRGIPTVYVRSARGVGAKNVKPRKVNK